MQPSQETQTIEDLLEKFRDELRKIQELQSKTATLQRKPKVSLQTFSAMLSAAANHASLFVFSPANFNAGRNHYTDDVISLSAIEEKAICKCLDPTFSALKNHVEKKLAP